MAGVCILYIYIYTHIHIYIDIYTYILLQHVWMERSKKGQQNKARYF